jgi:hypothetical protein
MTGPLPADQTPLRADGHPSQSFTTARRVARPVPAGKPRSQKRNRQARNRAKASTSSGARSRAWPVMQVCSVSSLTMPRPSRKRWRRGGSPKSLAARLRESPSRGRPKASPTAVPRITPAMRSLRSLSVSIIYCNELGISTSASRSLAAATWS